MMTRLQPDTLAKSLMPRVLVTRIVWHRRAAPRQPCSVRRSVAESPAVVRHDGREPSFCCSLPPYRAIDPKTRRLAIPTSGGGGERSGTIDRITRNGYGQGRNRGAVREKAGSVRQSG